MTINQILEQVAAGKLSAADAAALMPKQAAPSRITLKVSEKGGLSLYGLGRWPVTLYREQWERLLGERERIEAFIAEHSSELKAKGE